MNDDVPEVELPRGVALAWGVAANPQRGPKRELSIERIVDTAMAIADKDGLGAVSMSAIATALGFTTMSLYRYVTAKEDLILLMQEQGIGLPSAAIAGAPDWRTGLTLWSQESLEFYDAHPWLVEIPILGTPNTPNNLAWMDAALAVLENTPLPMEDRVGALLLVSGQTRWRASINRGYAISNSSLGMTPEERDLADVHVMMTLVTEEQFPALYPAIRAGALGPDEHDPFDFGLARVLDGIEAYMNSLGGPNPKPAAEPPGTTDAHPKDERVKLARQARHEAEKRLREAVRAEREAIKAAVERAKRG